MTQKFGPPSLMLDELQTSDYTHNNEKCGSEVLTYYPLVLFRRGCPPMQLLVQHQSTHQYRGQPWYGNAELAGQNQQHVNYIYPSPEIHGPAIGTTTYMLGTPNPHPAVSTPWQQNTKRRRKRHDEVERLYKCNWNGCEKSYGTLNHLNAHVTMQSHGMKRTPKDFKKMREELKNARKNRSDRVTATSDPNTSLASAHAQGQISGGYDYSSVGHQPANGWSLGRYGIQSCWENSYGQRASYQEGIDIPRGSWY